MLTYYNLYIIGMLYALDIFLVKTVINMMVEKGIKMSVNKFMKYYRKYKLKEEEQEIKYNNK